MMLLQPVSHDTLTRTLSKGLCHVAIEAKTPFQGFASLNARESQLTGNFITASGQKIGCQFFVASPRSVTTAAGLRKLRFDLQFQTVYKLFAYLEHAC